MFIDLGLFLYFAVLKAVRCANLDMLDDRESTVMLAALEGSTTVMLTCPQRQHIDFTDSWLMGKKLQYREWPLGKVGRKAARSHYIHF